MNQQIIQIPKEEYDNRIRNIQKILQERDIDLLITHACGCESATVRYLTDFWAVFDFVGVLVPREGQPILLTGGPESYDFARKFAKIDDVRVHPLYVETSAPEWDKPTDAWTYKMVIDEISQRFTVKRIGLANVNTTPHVIIKDIMTGAPDAELTEAEDIIMELRWYKSEREITLMREACRITEEGFKACVSRISTGVSEWEVQAAWMSKVYSLGAEGTGYPVWVTSGPNTYQSLCKSTDRLISNNEMVQLSLGAKYSGYCGNLGRVAVLGKLPYKHMKMIETAHDCLNDTLDVMKPGIPFADVYNRFQAKLNRAGFKGLNLYGPAHGTGLQECEGPWVDNRTQRILEPGMVFNLDIWIADDRYGVRLEDCVLVTVDRLEQLTSWRREIIYI